jgi:hypothetical protein
MDPAKINSNNYLFHLDSLQLEDINQMLNNSSKKIIKLHQIIKQSINNNGLTNINKKEIVILTTEIQQSQRLIEAYINTAAVPLPPHLSIKYKEITDKVMKIFKMDKITREIIEWIKDEETNTEKNVPFPIQESTYESKQTPQILQANATEDKQQNNMTEYQFLRDLIGEQQFMNFMEQEIVDGEGNTEDTKKQQDLLNSELLKLDPHTQDDYIVQRHAAIELYIAKRDMYLDDELKCEKTKLKNLIEIIFDLNIEENWNALLSVIQSSSEKIILLNKEKNDLKLLNSLSLIIDEILIHDDYNKLTRYNLIEIVQKHRKTLYSNEKEMSKTISLLSTHEEPTEEIGQIDTTLTVIKNTIHSLESTLDYFKNIKEKELLGEGKIINLISQLKVVIKNRLDLKEANILLKEQQGKQRKYTQLESLFHEKIGEGTLEKEDVKTSLELLKTIVEIKLSLDEIIKKLEPDFEKIKQNLQSKKKYINALFTAIL